MSSAHPLEQMRQRLAAFLETATGETVSITAASPLAGGASRDMWRVDAMIGSTPHTFVLRRDLPTVMVESALSRAEEFALMRAAYHAGVKVATPRYLCDDPSVLGGAFFLMDYLDGIAIGRKVVSMPELAAARAALPDQMSKSLAAIHQLDPSPFPFLRRPPAGDSPAQMAIRETQAMLDQLGVHNPIFEFCLAWAADRAPTATALTLCHGDFRIGNLMVDTQGLVAVADWEFAHIGDPDEELGYLCMRDWRFGNGHLRLGGIADREPFLQAYEAASGRRVDRTAVDFWEFLGNVRWGVICLSQAARHLSGRDPSVELASLGRRSAEMQLEALRMIERMGV